MHSTPPQTVGIFGAGKAGAVIARLALAAGLDVVVATSRSAADTAELLRSVAPGATATSAEDLPARADLVVLAVPLRHFHDLPLHLLAEHVVIDVMNHWAPLDGALPDFDEPDRPTSTVVRDALPAAAQLVKTFNHLGYHQMEDDARPVGAPDRAALAVAGDDPAAVHTVADLVDRLGFDPVPAGPLSHSAVMEPGSEIFGEHLDADTMRRTLAAAARDERAA
jgi:predicted dinucleotide-binding enzyme